MSRSTLIKGERSTAFTIAVSSVMAAMVCVATIIIQIPNPATMGYINVGDAIIYAGALIFGSAVGAFAGGVGSALADVISGYGYYAPLTLVVKGVEGLLVGLISDGANWKRDIVGVAVGGSAMILGYLLGQAYIMQYLVPEFEWGLVAALTEVPGNAFQVLAGGLIGIPLSIAVRRYLTVPRW